MEMPISKHHGTIGGHNERTTVAEEAQGRLAAEETDDAQFEVGVPSGLISGTLVPSQSFVHRAQTERGRGAWGCVGL